MGGNAADIEIRARAFWTDTEGGEHAVGFAASEDPEDGYVIFEGKPGDRKGLYLEVSDEIFAAKDAVESVVFSETGFVLTIKPAMQAKSLSGRMTRMVRRRWRYCGGWLGKG